MVVEFLTGEEEMRAFAELLRPEPNRRWGRVRGALGVRCNVPEVWFWRRQTLEMFALRDDGAAYGAVSQSRLLPDLDHALLERCVAIRSWQQARRAFRAGFGGSR
jgi:hypothetical protein